MKRCFRIIVIVCLVCLLGGCSTGMVQFAATPTPAKTPATAQPTEAVKPTDALTPSPTVNAEPTQAATPTPSASVPAFDITTMKDGGYNACATWDDEGKLVEAAEIAPGSMIFCNNLERHDGNRLASGNVFAGAELILNDSISQTGMFCMKVTSRKERTEGVSGFGLILGTNNGMEYKKLIGHTIELKCYLYYEDEGFGVPEELTFALYDGYHTERVMGYTYDRNNEIVVDKNGDPVLKERDAYVLCETKTVPKRTWTECTFRYTVKETDIEDGMLVIGTKDEEQNAVGMYAAYYIDDITITVIE